MDDVDPVQNTDALGGVDEKDLSFPFNPEAESDGIGKPEAIANEK